MKTYGHDLDQARGAYRNGLGMTVVDEWTQPSGQRGAGAERTGQVAQVAWEQTCQRIGLPGGDQLTLFVLPESERVVRAAARSRLPA